MHAVITVMIYVFDVLSYCQIVSWLRWVRKCSRESRIPNCPFARNRRFLRCNVSEGSKAILFSIRVVAWSSWTSVSRSVCVDAEFEEEKGKLEMLEDGSCYVM